jgi:hypothetical protein
MANLDMNKKQKAIRIVAALFIVSFFSFFLIFLNQNDCLEADFPSSRPKIEIFDQGYPLDNQQNNLEIFRPNVFTLITKTDLPEKLFSFFQPFPLNQKTINLRC